MDAKCVSTYSFLWISKMYELNVQEWGGVYDLKFSHIASNQVPFVLSRKPFTDVLEMNACQTFVLSRVHKLCWWNLSANTAAVDFCIVSFMKTDPCELPTGTETLLLLSGVL